MAVFHADNVKYQEDVKDLQAHKKEFDDKSAKFGEAVAKAKEKNMNDEQIKQELSDEGNRLRAKKMQVEQKVKTHNQKHDELEKTKEEVMKDALEFSKFQQELKQMKAEISLSVVEMKKMQEQVAKLAAEKKAQESFKLQQELITKHGIYAEKDKEFKTKVAEYQERQKQLQQTVKFVDMQLANHDDMTKLYQSQIDEVNNQILRFQERCKNFADGKDLAVKYIEDQKADLTYL